MRVGAITGHHHTGIQVTDLERSLGFYRDLLGLEVVHVWNRRAPYIEELLGYPGVDMHGVVMRMPDSDSVLEILEYRNVERKAIDPGTANPGTAHVAFRVDDCDALYEDLTRKGVKSVSAPVTPTIGPNKGGRTVLMLDPDGFRIELLQPPQ
ncbi:MAG: VOC family protein [Acidimicrobiia bacterium]|nr:VOC family protein [Acidimicrobiia bacterium]